MNQSTNATVRQGTAVFATNKLIRNTYILLSLTLLFSAATAGISMVANIPHPGLVITLVGYFGLLFLVQALRNSVWGIVSVFALTGFMGLTLGPILNLYISHFANGTQLVMTALGGTGAIFVGLSAYALTTRKDFSFMAGFLFAGILVAFLAGIGGNFCSSNALASGLGYVRLINVRTYSISNQRDDSWGRNKLHPSNSYPLCFNI